MTELFKTFYAFLSSFGVSVYPENGVPSDAVLPYMTWTPILQPWDAAAGLLPVRLWDRSENYMRLAELVDRISARIGEGQTLTAGSAGYIRVEKGNPFAQPQPLQDSDVKILYVNLSVTTLIA